MEIDLCGRPLNINNEKELRLRFIELLEQEYGKDYYIIQPKFGIDVLIVQKETSQIEIGFELKYKLTDRSFTQLLRYKQRYSFPVVLLVLGRLWFNGKTQKDLEIRNLIEETFPVLFYHRNDFHVLNSEISSYSIPFELYRFLKSEETKIKHNKPLLINLKSQKEGINNLVKERV